MMSQERKLYRIPQKGRIKGVCAGLAHYFDIPVTLIRVMAVLSLFFGLFAFTIVLYIVLCFVLKPIPTSQIGLMTPYKQRQLLNEADALMQRSEQRLREIERYVTSDTFNTRNRFRQL